MRKLIVLIIMITSVGYIFAQNDAKIPSVNLKTLDGKVFNTTDISNDGNPVIISFWATWCKPCVKELSVIADLYEDWQDETNVKLYAVSIDDSRSMSRVGPFVNGKGWEYEVLLDPNSEFKKAMNVINVPHTFLLDGYGKIVWQHTGFAEGNEEDLYELVQKLANGESVNHK